ncbi:MAG: DNA-3-methyladenine glycosylase 2 family protein, partial [Betaproteobacteria bacterium]|nr:DNA-3-methyladenine glycosylase 2 family protein [Betaproteobacteria bacterium]
MVPGYWKTARRALMRRDPVLAAILRRHAKRTLAGRSAPFFTLARSIVGQQLSVKAAATIWGRLESRVPQVAPDRLLAVPPAELLACGLSRRKLEYIVDLARHFEAGTLDPAAWPALEDEAIIAQLTAVRGIGRWTAEMFLIFNLLRPNVLPLADVGLQRAVARHYFSGRPISSR